MNASPPSSRIQRGRCAAVVLNYESAGPLSNCLSSLIAQTHACYEIIVVDNGSHDGSLQMVSEQFPRIVTIQTGSNFGTAAMNEGIKRALDDGCEYILLVDSDEVFDPDSIAILYDMLERNRGIGIAGPSCYENNRGDAAPVVRVNPRNGLLETEKYVVMPSPTDCIGTALVRAQVFDSIGRIEPGFFAYFQDTDFSLRAGRAGFEIFIVPASKFHHLEGYAVRKVEGLRGWVSIRNRCLLIKRNFPPITSMRFLLALPAELVKGLGHWFLAKEYRELQAAIIGAVSGVFYLVTGDEPGILVRIIAGLLEHRVNITRAE